MLISDSTFKHEGLQIPWGNVAAIEDVETPWDFRIHIHLHTPIKGVSVLEVVRDTSHEGQMFVLRALLEALDRWTARATRP